MKRYQPCLLLPACLAIVCLSFVVAPASAEPAKTSRSNSVTIVTPLPQRFAAADSGQTPNFQKHVIPLMGRLGCNGRACHGSFQGRGGFQLSLFGYDFAADHKAMMDEASGRVDVDYVDDSLVLAKPIDADAHEGGKRMDPGSWQYNVIQSWIQSGAKFSDEKPLKLERLQVTPAEILVTGDRSPVNLKATAHWADGTVEDVTELCRFSTNDEAIADVNETGTISPGTKGDTHVVVYYDNAVVPVSVLSPISRDFGKRYTASRPSHPVDQKIHEKLSKLGIEPSELCTDSEFVRRLYLDMTGTLPSPEQVVSFLDDADANKRDRLIDELLSTPEYAAWWATRFSDWTGNSEVQMNNLMPVRGSGSRLWYSWLKTRLQNNTPYDEIVNGIVVANNRMPGESYLEYCEAMSEACRPGGEEKFSERDGLPQFWARNNFRTPEERAIGFAYTFLGVRIQCAQCHKHPFDQWSKNDFDEFAKLFGTVQARNTTVAADSRKDRQKLIDSLIDDSTLRGNQIRNALSKKAAAGEVVPFPELVVVGKKESGGAKTRRRQKEKRLKQSIAPEIPTGHILGQPTPVKLDGDPRGPIMQWLRSPQNPYFAKAIVNRVWANYFGIGIVDPTDDMNLANPPSNAALLDHLADSFVKSEFDLHWLHRTITTSDAYQRSFKTNESNVADKTNFSHHLPRRLPAEVVHDAILLATAGSAKADAARNEFKGRAISQPSPNYRGNNASAFALTVFGQSIRETQCDCDRSEDASLLQTIYMRNDGDVHRQLTEKSGWIAEICKELGIPSPAAIGSPSQSAGLKRRADATIAAIKKRVVQYKGMTERQQLKMQPRLVIEIAKAKTRLAEYGFELPEKIASLGSDLSGDDTITEATKTVPTIDWDPVVTDAYLRVLSRHPESFERATAVSFIESSENPTKGIEGLVWTLVNTKEFILTH